MKVKVKVKGQTKQKMRWTSSKIFFKNSRLDLTMLVVTMHTWGLVTILQAVTLLVVAGKASNNDVEDNDNNDDDPSGDNNCSPYF